MDTNYLIAVLIMLAATLVIGGAIEVATRARSRLGRALRGRNTRRRRQAAQHAGELDGQQP